MLDRIIDILQTAFHALLPWKVVQPYENGVLIRLGVFKQVLPPGFHWIWPLQIDHVLTEHITPTTHHIEALATTTRDNYSIGFDAIVTYRIADIQKALLEVSEVKDAIVDTCVGIIGTTLSEAAWTDVLHGEAVDTLTAACRKRGWRWGVEIISVQLAGVCAVKNIRLSGARPPAVRQVLGRQE